MIVRHALNSIERLCSGMRRLVPALGVVALLAPAARAGTLPDLPPGFVAQEMTGSLTSPVAMSFAPDGRLFVAEKRGMVRVYLNGTKLANFIDLRSEVNNSGDRGMLGIAVDPNFLSNRYVYLFFAVDPTEGSPDEPAETPTYGRVVRYKGTSASNGNIADPNSRMVLLGSTPSKGTPACWTTHSVGCLRFAPDGSLLVSVGDGAKYEDADGGGETPDCFVSPLFGQAQNIGAFRSQLLASTSGKILRINPANGKGYPSNPYYDGNLGSVASKVWAYGLRNPFRFTVKPGSYSGIVPTLFVADVGWSVFEELDAVHGGENFGWPCFEGFESTPDYAALSPTAGGCDTIETAGNPGPLTAPIMAWNHVASDLSIPTGLIGSAGMTGAYVGTKYPAPYRKRIVVADFIQGWIKMVRVDSADQFSSIVDFAENAAGPTDFAIDPTTQELCYVSMLNGRVYRFHDNSPSQLVAGGLSDPGDSVGCPADIAPAMNGLKGDGVVDVTDLLEAIHQIASSAPGAQPPDIAAILNAWGACP